jgi:hypothetical protein
VPVQLPLEGLAALRENLHLPRDQPSIELQDAAQAFLDKLQSANAD